MQTTYEAVVDVIRSAEGISGLYAGLNSSLLGISVTNLYVLIIFTCIIRLLTMISSVYYYFYEKGRSSLLAARSSPGSKGLSTMESLLNGFIAGT
jgi:solute carrier family 25 (peroxisomal adenine nucleotide transporter), member 17